jgi:hypothetical protein
LWSEAPSPWYKAGNLSKKLLKQKWTGGMAEVVAHLSTKLEALSSNSFFSKKEKKKIKQQTKSAIDMVHHCL